MNYKNGTYSINTTSVHTPENMLGVLVPPALESNPRLRTPGKMRGFSSFCAIFVLLGVIFGGEGEGRVEVGGVVG
jgi:hypothetical protein